MAAKLDKIREAAERVAASYGLDVVEIEMTGGGEHRVLAVYLEKNAAGRERLKAELEEKRDEYARLKAEGAAPEFLEVGGVEIPERILKGRAAMEHLSFITHEDCENVARELGVILDVEELVPGGVYTLETSSPGLDRKLTKAEDFARFVGSLVKLQTFEAISGNRHWQGRLVEGKSGVITIDLSAIKQNAKSKKSGVKQVELEFANVEKARLQPEI